MDSHNPALAKPNFDTDEYDQERHEAYIYSRIRHFDQTYNWALGSLVGSLAIAGLGLKALSLPVTLLLMGVLRFSPNNPVNSSSTWDDFHNSLRELEKIFLWCLKNKKQNNITQDVVVCALFESIAPLKDAEGLKLLIPQVNGVSKRFKDVLIAPPHHYDVHGVMSSSGGDSKLYVMRTPNPKETPSFSLKSCKATVNYFIFNEKAEPYYGMKRHATTLLGHAWKFFTAPTPNNPATTNTTLLPVARPVETKVEVAHPVKRK